MLRLVGYDGSRPREERPGPRSREVKRERATRGTKKEERIKNAKEKGVKKMGDNRVKERSRSSRARTVCKIELNLRRKDRSGNREIEAQVQPRTQAPP